MSLYFAYGSNLHLGQMAHRCPGASVLSAGSIPGYRLVFRESRPGSSYASIEPAEGFSVPVVAWLLTTADERSLDRYEGFPVLYSKKTLRMNSPLGSLEGMAYIMNPPYAAARPSQGYLATIRTGYFLSSLPTAPLDAAIRECEARSRWVR